MRITEGMMTASYNRNLQTNLSDLDVFNMKPTSKRQLNHVLEDPVQAAKAFPVRTQIARNERYPSVMENAGSEPKATSDNATNLTSIPETVIKKNFRVKGIMDQIAMSSTAEELKGLKEEALALVNVQYGDKYLFGGTGVGGAPSTTDDSGALLYNGKAVDKHDPDNPDTRFPSNKDVYLDVGYESMGLNGGNRGIKVSTSDVEVLGYGADDRGRVNSLCLVTDDIENKLRARDQTGAIKSLANSKDKWSYVTAATVGIGMRQNMLRRIKSRLSSKLSILQESQDNLEGVDMKKEAINYQELKTTRQTTLQIDSALILPSIFNFINQQREGIGTNVNVLKITLTPIQLFIIPEQVRLGVRASESDTLAALDIQQQLNMKTQNIEVDIDSSRTQNSIECQSANRTAIQYAKAPAQTLVASKTAGSVASQTVTQVTAATTGEAVVPTGEIPGLGAGFTPGMVEREKNVAKAERSMEYVSGKLKISVEQHPKVEIEYIEEPIYSPRSTGQKHEG